MKLILVLALILPYSYTRTVSKGNVCYLSLKDDIPEKNEPVYLTKEKGSLGFTLPVLDGKSAGIELNAGEDLVITCPGRSNHVEATNTETVTASCKSGNKLKINNKDFNSKDITCKGKTAASLSITKEICARGKGKIIDIGFKSEGWQQLVKVCHDIENSHTYFTTHTIFGSVLAGKVIRSIGRPSFAKGEKSLFPGVDVDTSYKQETQEELLTKMFKAKAKTYIDAKANKFLARGHLTPDADFVFGSMQMATYFYINAAPQWQAINAGNWLRTEENARKVSTALLVDMDVATGTHGVLALTDKSNKEQKIYFDGKSKLPVPEYYWKVLHNPNDDSCIALVSTNNPYLSSPPTPICNDICTKYNWPKLQNDLSKGYVYCCTYDDFKKAVVDVPDFKCKSVMNFAK